MSRLPQVYTLIPVLKRYVTTGVSVLKTHGAKVFFEILKAKIKQRFSPETLPHTVYTLSRQIGPLTFPVKTEAPLISILIPMGEDPVIVYSCLKSIHEHTDSPDYEILIADDGSQFHYTRILKMVENIRIVRHEKGLTVSASINRCAVKAGGQYLLILNTHMMMTEKWAGPLRKTFACFPQTGCAAAKVIFPDGRLSDAGGSMDESGILLSRGYLMPHQTPEFNYACEVDFATDGCFMIPRILFMDLGMLDLSYKTLPYAAADLAGRLKDSQKKTVFQPCSMFVRFDSASDKYDQESDKSRFVTKWKSAERLSVRMNRDHSKKILVLDARMIEPDQDSGSYRMFEMLGIFQEIGCRVTFCSVNLEYREPYTKELQERGIEVLYQPFVSSVEEYVQHFGKNFDMIVLSRIIVADRLIDAVKQYAPQAFVIFDTVDLHFLREQREAVLKNSEMLMQEAEKRKNQEISAGLKSDVMLVVSSVEKEILSGIRPEINVEILSNIHEIRGSQTAFAQRKDIMFIGGFEHAPNVDAMLYFTDSIFPLIRNIRSDIKLYIVGSKPPEQILSLSSEHVAVTGFVKDVSPFFNQCRVFVSPLRYGAGIKGKINMSMSYGLPAVATSISVEGMHVKENEDILVADDAASFAEKVMKLYEDEQLWRNISENGLKNIENYFSRGVALSTLSRILEKSRQ